MSFPLSPINGQTAVLNGITYVYSSANTAWTRVAQGTTSTVSLVISGTATSTSTITGALQVAGGAGIGGNLNVGGTITAPSIYVGPWAVSTGSSLTNISPYSGIFTITNTAVSISTNSGALQVTGGVGVGGTVFANAFTATRAFQLGVSGALGTGTVVWSGPGTSSSSNPWFGIYSPANSLYFGIATSLPAPSGTSVVGGYWQGMGIGGATNNTNYPIFGVLNSAQSGGSNGTGQVAFNVFDNNKVFTFNNTLDDGSGNLTVVGNTLITKSPTGTQTYGGVLQVGTTLNFSDTNILSSFAENTNTYAQVVLQNLNGGSSSSADFIVNNNSTTGASIYGDFGINGTGYSGIDPFSDPSGTYLYSAGGSLSIGTTNAFNFKVATNDTVALTITPDQNARFVGVVTATNMFVGPWAVSTGLGVLSVANALTINNGGSGAASGSTYNGSSPVTISYNTVGAPGTNGTNATGTWNIVAGAALIANSVTNLLTINSAGTGAASPQTYNGSTALTISYNTVGAPGTNGTNATGTWNIVAGSAVTATYAAVAYSLASTATIQIQFATSATTATSAAVAYSLANTATTQVGYAVTATSAAVAYSLANTSTTQVGYSVNATNLINTASTLVGYANYAYGFNTSTLVTTAVTALNVSNVNTVLQTASANYYPTFVNANNASPASESLYTTSSFSINPATGLVSHSTSTINVNGWTLGINPPGVPTISTSTASSYPTGFYAANLYSSSGYPSSYGYLQSMSSNYANSMAQTYFSWTGYGDQTGSPGQPAYMWVRTNRDSNNQFGAWQQVLLLQQNGDLSLGTAHSYGSGNMNMSGIFTSTNVTNASSTITGALQVAGGAGIGQNLYVGGSIYSGGTQLLPSVIQEFSATAGQTIFTTTNAYTVGSVQVYANGIALGNGDFTATNGTTITLNVGRTLGDVIRIQSAATSVNAVTTSAVTVLGGTSGQLLYQSASGTTAFAGPGTAGQVLISQGTGAPLYQSTLTVIGSNVGVGTSSPGAKLDISGPALSVGSQGTYALSVYGSGGSTQDLTFSSDASKGYIQTWNSKSLVINSQGNSVGIGTSSVTNGSIFEVSGSNGNGNIVNVRSIGTSQYSMGGISFLNGATATNYSVTIGSAVRDSNGTNSYFQIFKATTASGFVGTMANYDLGNDTWGFYTANTQRLFIGSAGNIGVGTASPSSTLHVSGTTLLAGVTTVSNTLYMLGNTVNNPLFQSYKEYVNSSTVSTTSLTLDLSTANIFRLTMSSNVTSLTFSNPPASGTAFSFMLYCQQDATGSRTISWPASVKWPNGSTPTMTTTANKIDIFNFFTLDGGTSYIGALSLANL